MTPPVGGATGAARAALRNTALNAIRFIAILAANLLSSALVARALGPTDTGIYTFVVWLGGILAVTATAGLPGALTKYIAEYAARGRRDLAVALTRRMLRPALWAVLGLGLAGGGYAAVFLHGADQRLLLISLGIFVPQTAQLACTAILAGWQRYGKIALLGLYGAGAQVAFIGTAWILGAGTTGMLWAACGSVVVWAVLCYRTTAPIGLLRMGVPYPEVGAAMRRVRRFWLIAAWVMLLDAVVWQRSEVLFLRWFSPLAQVAFYSLAYAISGKLAQVAGVFTNVLLPICSERFGRSGLAELWPVYRQALRYVQMGMVPLCLEGIFLARPLTRWVYGARFFPLVPALQVLLATLAFTCIGSVGSALIYGADKPEIIALLNTPVAAMNVALDVLLIRRFGALGAAYANGAAQATGVLLGLVYIHWLLRHGYPWASTMRIGFASFVAALPAGLCQWQGYGGAVTLGAAVVGLAAYPWVLAGLREVGRREWELIWGVLRAGSPRVIGRAEGVEGMP